MEDHQEGKEKPFWVVFWPLAQFISGHDTLEEATIEENRLTLEAHKRGDDLEFKVIPRPDSQ